VDWLTALSRFTGPQEGQFSVWAPIKKLSKIISTKMVPSPIGWMGDGPTRVSFFP